ncbi:MAG: outer membrane lipoprotein carrier protein LolA [Rhodospirillales bacterium]
MSVKLTGSGAAKFLSARIPRGFPNLILSAVIALAVAGTAISPVRAEPAQLAKLTTEDRGDIKRIENYLNALRTVEARFLQVSSNGGYAEGRLYISRPGKMRIDYAPPAKLEIVADGKSLIYHDKELEQISHIALEDTPANILLQKNVRLLSGPVRVRSVSRGPGIVQIDMVKVDDPQEGSVALVFGDRPLALKKWTITDAQGVITTVSLLRSRFDAPIDPKIFTFDDPDYELFRNDS